MKISAVYEAEMLPTNTRCTLNGAVLLHVDQLQLPNVLQGQPHLDYITIVKVGKGQDMND